MSFRLFAFPLQTIPSTNHKARPSTLNKHKIEDTPHDGHATHLTYPARSEDWSFSIEAKYARLRFHVCAFRRLKSPPLSYPAHAGFRELSCSAAGHPPPPTSAVRLRSTVCRNTRASRAPTSRGSRHTRHDVRNEGRIHCRKRKATLAKVIERCADMDQGRVVDDEIAVMELVG